MRSPIALFTATSLTALAPPAWAADVGPETVAAAAAATADAGDSAESDEKIVVEGQRETYGVRNIRSATKTNTPLRNVPQAVSVISASQIEDQQLRSIGEALYFVPGASVGTGEGNRDRSSCAATVRPRTSSSTGSATTPSTSATFTTSSAWRF